MDSQLVTALPLCACSAWLALQAGFNANTALFNSGTSGSGAVTLDMQLVGVHPLSMARFTANCNAGLGLGAAGRE